VYRDGQDHRASKGHRGKLGLKVNTARQARRGLKDPSASPDRRGPKASRANQGNVLPARGVPPVHRGQLALQARQARRVS
jgi:hypothetical protein